MPEYLSPGVYIEETTFRSKSIEGVATSTTGFAGSCRYGPVQYVDGNRPGPRSTEARLITSFTEFERVYGGLEPIVPADGSPARESYLAHAARAFFLNGGRRLYVSRVFAPTGEPPDLDFGLARLPLPFGTSELATWRARWPGSFGNTLVTVRGVRKRNCAYQNDTFGTQATALGRGAVVEITEPPAAPPAADANLVSGSLAVVEEDLTVRDTSGRARQTFRNAAGTAVALTATTIIKEVVLQVLVQPDPERIDAYTDLATHPAQRRWIGHILQADDPEDENAVVFLDTDAPDDPADVATLTRAIGLMLALETPTEGARLTNGHDGAVPAPSDLFGDDASPDIVTEKATGLCALGEIDDIAIVALPDGGTYDDVELCREAANLLITHADRLKYRIAVVDAPRASSLTEVRAFRGKFDSNRAAMYHPWIEVFDPLQRPAQGAPPRRILLPPSGFVTGIYARNDVTRGVFKAPANEVVQGLTRFEANINTARNDVLNPEGINALRFFPGRGNRVWGARTMSSDPEWQYVNVRRLFLFIEHSIDLAMQYAVFEPNNERLWASIRQSVEDFLYVQWLSGALLGSKPDEAFFVRCDRTTMTQNDLDNGRLVCLIGVAPTKPAEFVIFRIGQFTADARA